MSLTTPDEQRKLALSRLTALWAFSESGLGGMMHAFRFPFTGLLVGGFAVIIITLIAYFSNKQYGRLLQSLIIVLIVKAAVSPHTPFPAYVAVLFQGMIGYLLFLLGGVNLITILLLGVLAMVESAIQKLLMLTLFFGQSLWKATDQLVHSIAEQFSVSVDHGGNLVAMVYVGIYFIGGIVISLLAYRFTKRLSSEPLEPCTTVSVMSEAVPIARKRRRNRWLFFASLLLAISLVLYFFGGKDQHALVSALQSIIWAVSAVLLWYVIVNPLLTKLIVAVLNKRRSKYSAEVSEVLAFLPVQRQLAAQAWQQSKGYKRFQKLSHFLYLLIRCSLTYTAEPVNLP